MTVGVDGGYQVVSLATATSKLSIVTMIVLVLRCWCCSSSIVMLRFFLSISSHHFRVSDLVDFVSVYAICVVLL
ncbi:hypothetical protein RchiOBHm_Chr2g0134691 [Rosa chinensis]|uniref:Uncharacterized protein n=1 Tax=Rosa chinensis TaxID=74649 RepID=A0A2P6RVX0_ROSCH|nr:hypothetical protein RchiOBHm_Chr2g0134691 [Rosa chinensis]